MDIAAEDVEGHNAAADVVFQQQLERVPFAVEADAVAQGLLVDRVE
jgi:hypothetical protein